MIVGLGIDICQIERIESSYRRYGERLLRRILHLSEYGDLTDVPANARGRFLARRFAAKEAALKALGTGARNGITLGQAIVLHDALGKPLLQFTDAAADRARQLRAQAILLSISDERDYATAVVVIEALP